MKLTGQAAIITGSSSGIGRACALGLAREGVRVTINYHSDEQEGQLVVDEINAIGGAAILVQADVSKPDDVERMFNDTIHAFGRLDILVNNAGMQKDAALEDMTLEDWNRVINVNMTGQFICAQAAVRQFLKQGIDPEVSRAAGKIISINSVHDRIPWAGHINYATSKGGLRMMTETIAQEVAGRGIRVNSISPGAIATDINRSAWEKEADLKKLLTKIPYGRIGQGEDVANLCTFLCSDLSDYITGATIYIDGGMMLYPSFREGG
ncbi:MAG: glucose 1-dehydrogenase [Saprospiraceae bacterium]